MTILVRIGLALLFLDELVVGAWNAVWPAGFYQYFPTVNRTPPFSEHYARDFGGATLGIALLLGIALVKPKAYFVVPAALAYSAFSVPHFFYHRSKTDGMTHPEACLLTSANAFVALLGIAIVLATVARDRRLSRGRTRIAPRECRRR
jgi:hypothetical protein